MQVFRPIDDLVRHVDRLQDRQQIETVGDMVLVMIPDRAAQGCDQEDRDLIGVVDLGDGVDQVMNPDAPISANEPMRP